MYEEILKSMHLGKKIKQKSKKKMVLLWMLATAFGCSSDAILSRKLRNLSEDDFQKLDKMIDTLAEEMVKE